MDYAPSLIAALKNAKSTTSVWNGPSIDHALEAVRALSQKGTISAKNALLISTLFPTAFTFASTPLVEIKAKDAGTGPSSTGLAPAVRQGLQSWYWNLTNFMDAAGRHVTGILFVIKQTTIDAATGVSVWSIDAGAVDPVTKAWVSPSTVYLDNDMVHVVENGLVFKSSAIAGSVFVTATQFYIAVTFPSGFSFAVTSTSRRGPTYEQSSGNVKRIGALQNGYWSIVDGAVHSGSIQCTATSARNSYTSGMSWLDYQQFGFAGITDTLQFLNAAFKVPPQTVQWMFLVVQAPSFQLDAYILNLKGASLTTKLKNQKIMTSSKTVNYWEISKPAEYDLDCIIQVLEVYPAQDGVSGVPSKVALHIKGVTYTLTSICTSVPALITAGGSGYESPASVSWSDDAGHQQFGTGVIEWVPGNMYPTVADVLTESGVSKSILKSGAPNPAAQAFISLFIISIVLFIVCIVVAAVSAARHK